MKKSLASFWVFFMLFGLITIPSTQVRAEGHILCASFPVYLFTKNITQGRDNFKISLLGEKISGCSHDYTPTPKDLEELSRAEVLIVNGLGFEAFLSQALKVAKNDIKIIDASGGIFPFDQALDPQKPQIVLDKNSYLQKYSNLQCNHAPGEPHVHGDDEHNSHIFASPSLASAMLGNIASALSQIDEAGRDIYMHNANTAIADMEKTAAFLKSSTSSLPSAPKVIAGHGVFDYMAKDAGFEIVGHIEEADGVAPSATHLAVLSNLAKRENVVAILIDPDGNVDMARALGAETKLPVAVIDPVASGPLDAPLDYYQKVMATDAKVLSELFSTKTESPNAKNGAKK